MTANPDDRYNPIDFDEFLLDVEEGSSHGPSVDDDGQELPSIDVETLEIPIWIKYLISTGRDPTYRRKYPSRSEAHGDATEELLKAGIDERTILSLLLDERYKISERPREKGRAWLATDIARIKAKLNGHRPHVNGAQEPEAHTPKDGDDQQKTPQEETCPPTSETVLPFPVDVLPKPLARFVHEAAAALPAPPEFVGVPMLAMLGISIGAARVLEVKPGWHESARIYCAVVADPGTKKSPALDYARKPLDNLQDRLVKAHKEAMEHYRVDMNQYDIDIADWTKRVREGTATAPSKPSAPESPSLKRVYTTDTTIEALVGLLNANPRGILFVRDELTGWALAMNQYKGGKGADRQSWLSFWNGSPVTVDRKSRAEALFVANPFVCVTGCLPPDVLGDLADERGREDGFVHRIMFAMPDYAMPVWTDEAVSDEARQGYDGVVQKLRAMEGVKVDGEGPFPQVLTFTAEGKQLFIRFSNSLHADMQAVTFPAGLRGPWSKLEGYGARLALIIHLARWVSGEAQSEDVDDISMLSASALIDYFCSHARRVYSHLHSTKEDKQVVGAIAWIKAQGGRVTAREVLRNHVGGVKTSRDAKDLLETLADRGYGEVSPGEKRSVVFTLFAEKSC